MDLVHWNLAGRRVISLISVAAVLTMVACGGSGSGDGGGTGGQGAVPGTGGQGAVAGTGGQGAVPGTGGIGGASPGGRAGGAGGASGAGGAAGAGATGGASACRSQGQSCSQAQPCCGPLICAGSCSMGVSDRNAKRDFAPVNPEQILESVAALPISTWSYKAEVPAARHIGPMAQDFKATFHVGASDKLIYPLDENGVALAAIQALDARVRRLERQNARLARRLHDRERHK